jgi:hypothetical protein
MKLLVLSDVSTIKVVWRCGVSVIWPQVSAVCPLKTLCTAGPVPAINTTLIYFRRMRLETVTSHVASTLP